MAVVNMTKRPYAKDGWHYTESILTTATGNTIRIPSLPAGKTITATLIAGAGSGYIQFTTSSDAAVTAGTATWQTWSQGTKTGTVSDDIPISTAVRAVSVSGTITIEVLI